MSGLEIGGFVNDVKYRTTKKLHDVNNDMIVKVNIMLQGERESSKRLLVFLTVMIVLGEIFEHKKINIMTRSLKIYV